MPRLRLRPRSAGRPPAEGLPGKGRRSAPPKTEPWIRSCGAKTEGLLGEGAAFGPSHAQTRAEWQAALGRSQTSPDREPFRGRGRHSAPPDHECEADSEPDDEARVLLAEGAAFLLQFRLAGSGPSAQGIIRGVDEENRTELEPNYPDVLAAGTLSAALTRTLAKLGSPLTTAEVIFQGRELVGVAIFKAETRACLVCTAWDERSFQLSLSENDFELAAAGPPDLTTAASIIRRWLEDGRKATDITHEFDVRLTERAESYERGTLVEESWQTIVAASFNRHDDVWHEDELPDLIRLAAERPELRRLVPYTSMNRFGVSRKRPPDAGLPVIWPLGNGRFSLTPYWGGEWLAEGDAFHVLDALEAFIQQASSP